MKKKILICISFFKLYNTPLLLSLKLFIQYIKSTSFIIHRFVFFKLHQSATSLPFSYNINTTKIKYVGSWPSQFFCSKCVYLKVIMNLIMKFIPLEDESGESSLISVSVFPCLINWTRGWPEALQRELQHQGDWCYSAGAWSLLTGKVRTK